ncbi:MAG: 2-succinyl-5-enolpyruvyl-6-hydroxy-3-cyclohexene-1-carboxylic-acid synthase [Bacteroidales bacterium]|nr:2-succinyl-5-enolpyruvyl-6-hydroxy-3-cyclohexene-1-carboxylic-acid synthase [Bacteroidales bacterium]
MPHPLQHITDLSEICYQAGFAYVVISPGSRNAPLIDAFSSRFQERCYSIVDERSAAYFGLGLSRESGKPVALLCTSGTAVLNYAPGLAEAYYQQVPLLAVTADRPAEWIDQQDNQTIRQEGIYRNYIKHSVVLPEKMSSEENLEQAHSRIAKAIAAVCIAPRGPVHLNVPLHEPLYGGLPSASPDLPVQDLCLSSSTGAEIPHGFLDAWTRAGKILILQGQGTPDRQLHKNLECLCQDHRLVLMAENISNQYTNDAITTPDLYFAQVKDGELPEPDLLIYTGGQLVSKRIKTYLRGIRVQETWRVGVDAYPMDTFRQENKFVPSDAGTIFEKLGSMIQPGAPSEFKSAWMAAARKVLNWQNELQKSLPFSDVSVVRDILNSLPSGTRTELGNSSAIRYSQLVPARADLIYYSNRGVSGIDGCLSTASGTAAASGEPCYIILGDLSFVYDSNALWNRALSKKLRIIVLNNQGGGIFGLIEGPGKKAAFKDYFLAHHPVDLQKLAEAFNLNYFCVKDKQSLQSALAETAKGQNAAVVVEVLTEQEINTLAYHRVMQKD